MKITFTSSLLITFCIIGGIYAESPNGLICWIKCDEGETSAKIKDSISQAEGEIKSLGKGVHWGDGKNGNGLEFSADELSEKPYGCIVFPMQNSFPDGITVEAWIRPAASALKSPHATIVTSFVGDSGPGFELLLAYGEPQFRSGSRSDNKIWAARPVASVRWKANTWYHLAGTWDGSTFRLFLNGEEIGASATGLNLTAGRNSISIGASFLGSAYGFSGTIDDIKIYSKALTAEQISKEME